MITMQNKIGFYIILLLGIILMIFQISIYRNTIINHWLLVCIVVCIGVISYLINFKKFKEKFRYSGFELKLYSIMYYFFGFGFIFVSLFTLTNYYLAENNGVKKEFDIIKRSNFTGTGAHINIKKPVITINYDGIEKELVFYTKYYDRVKSYKKVELEIHNGFFGFEIIKNKNLK